MPVYNGMPYLSATIQAILRQTFRDFEFLIIDDCSTDGSQELIQSFPDQRIRFFVNERNLGQTATLNKGLELASGDYIARQDQDDLSIETRLEKQLNYLDEHPNVILLGTGTNAIDQTDKTVFEFDIPTSHEQLQWLLLTECPIFHSSVMFRRDYVRDRMKGYDNSYRYSQDYDLWSRIAWSARIATLPETLNLWRVHPAATSSTIGSIKEVEPLRTSFDNVQRLGLDISLNEWRRVWNIYTGMIEPEDTNELCRSIDMMFRLNKLFLQYFDDSAAADLDKLRRWIKNDITQRFIYRLATYLSNGRQEHVTAGLYRLAYHTPSVLWYGRSVFQRLLLGEKNYDRLYRLLHSS